MNEKVEVNKYQEFNEMVVMEMMHLKENIANIKQEATNSHKDHQNIRE